MQSSQTIVDLNYTHLIKKNKQTPTSMAGDLYQIVGWMCILRRNNRDNCPIVLTPLFVYQLDTIQLTLFTCYPPPMVIYITQFNSLPKFSEIKKTANYRNIVVSIVQHILWYIDVIICVLITIELT